MSFEELECLEAFQLLVSSLETQTQNKTAPTQQPKNKNLLTIFNDGNVERN